jgi:hypothetical protein
MIIDPDDYAAEIEEVLEWLEKIKTADTYDLYEVSFVLGVLADVQANLEYVSKELIKAEGLLDLEGGFEG